MNGLGDLRFKEIERLDIRLGLGVDQAHYFLLVVCTCCQQVLSDDCHHLNWATDLACCKKGAVLMSISMQSERKRVLLGSSCRSQGQDCHFL